jgi:4-hydroxybenzoate polyprenyltransferase
MIRTALSLLRPKQWVKNVVVFAALIFSKEFFVPGQLLFALGAFCAFCLTASAVYIINDIFDAEADRAHPEKRHRPIASEAITRKNALILLAALLLIDGLLLSFMHGMLIFLVVAYFLMNLAYSFKLKEIVLLDVFVIAAGFMLRVLGGAYAIGVQVSSWIVLCSMFISLFLGFAKRRAELVNFIMSKTEPPRRVLRLYRVDFLDQMLTITGAGTVISYALYTVAPRTTQVFGTDDLIYTTIFVLYGVFRYLYLIHASKQVENPTDALISDVPILANGTIWILACIYLIYFHGKTPLFP